METNSTACSSFSSSSSSSYDSSFSGSSIKMSRKLFLQPNRVILKKSSTEKRMMKHPIAPLPKIPPKIYKVEKNDFKKVVQKLTGLQPLDGDQPIRRLKDLAPPPLDLSLVVPTNGTAMEQAETIFFHGGSDIEIMGQVEFDHDYFQNLETLIMISPKLLTPSCCSVRLGRIVSPFSPAFTLSPASLSWCSLYLSPGTLSSLDQSVLLGGY